MNSRVKTVSPSGVVEFITKPVVESISEGVDWGRGTLGPAARSHIAEQAKATVTVSYLRSKANSAPATQPRKPVSSEVGSVNGVIFANKASKKAKRPGYKQVGLQKQIKKVAGFAGWK